MDEQLIRVFPRRTNATPTDELVRVDQEPYWFDEADAVHISVTFSWDMARAEELAKAWEHVAPVTIGGPATGQRGEEFVAGRYIRHGYTITSRGCPNNCWFCDVWRREGGVRELPIVPGWNVLDDNLLACSRPHIEDVFRMLSEQKATGHQVQFTGGLEANRLEDWHIQELRPLRPKQMFFAYDTPDDLEPLRDAGRRLLAAGWTVASKTLRCYVLCGYPRDTLEMAESRMIQTLDAGFWPMAMVYRDKLGNKTREWARFQRRWARPAIIRTT
jgi:hypothetical protein